MTQVIIYGLIGAFGLVFGDYLIIKLGERGHKEQFF